jgi:hypothetical protein
MPGYDGTGPRGMGAMTGWGRGFCRPLGTRWGLGLRRGVGLGFGRAGWGARGYGRGPGYGLGRVGYGGPVYAPSAEYGEPVSASEERELLRQEMQSIEEQLAEIRARLSASDDE